MVHKSKLHKVLIVFIIISGLWNCTKNEIKHEIELDHLDNNELIEIYKNDQKERSTNNIDWFKLYVNDSLRRIRVNQLLDSGKVITGRDYARAAMVFQHGKDSSDYGKALSLMELAIKKDSTISKWLLAAATDRYLLSKGEPQIYGTQYTKNKDEPWKRDTMDISKISDAQRKAFGVRTLKQQEAYVVEMNKDED